MPWRPDQVICNGHSRRDKTKPCTQPAIKGSTKCRYHGGKSLRGIAHPNYKGLGYAKSLPARMAQTYEAAMKDPRLFSVRKDAAACRARLHELFERLDTGESGALWKGLSDAHAAFAAARASGDTTAMKRHFDALQGWIVRGQGDYAAWEDVRATWDSLCKLATTEQKTLVAMQQVLSMEQVALYFGVIAKSVFEIVVAHAEGAQRQKMLVALEGRFEHLANLDTDTKVG